MCGKAVWFRALTSRPGDCASGTLDFSGVGNSSSPPRSPKNFGPDTGANFGAIFTTLLTPSLAILGCLPSAPSCAIPVPPPAEAPQLAAAGIVGDHCCGGWLPGGDTIGDVQLCGGIGGCSGLMVVTRPSFPICHALGSSPRAPILDAPGAPCLCSQGANPFPGPLPLLPGLYVPGPGAPAFSPVPFPVPLFRGLIGHYFFQWSSWPQIAHPLPLPFPFFPPPPFLCPFLSL